MLANRLMHILQNDKNALKKFTGVSSKEDALKVAQGLIPDYTESELLNDVQNIQHSYIKNSSLSSSQLEDVVGGAINWGALFTTTVPIILLDM
ncbi:MAG: hypothetical protein LBT69_02150 [Lactobacillales bacterium]|jgi:hypothetical protein|nr:hypothetical protein [Lactobacillales bacterium]